MRLLVIEDDDDIAGIIAQTLELDHHVVDRATNGTDGLWMAQEGRYGVIVLDILLPAMNGYKVCESLRAGGSSTPVLMLTAKVGDYDETNGFDVGADDYLRKPFAPHVLRARVNALLRRGRQVQSTASLQRGGVCLDGTTRRCTVGSVPVELTSREAQVLEVLLRAGDVPSSRLELLDAVWGLDFDGPPNVVDVYIRYLRVKVGADTIENVRGLGYRIRG